MTPKWALKKADWDKFEETLRATTIASPKADDPERAYRTLLHNVKTAASIPKGIPHRGGIRVVDG